MAKKEPKVPAPYVGDGTKDRKVPAVDQFAQRPGGPRIGLRIDWEKMEVIEEPDWPPIVNVKICQKCRGENPQPLDRPAPCFGEHNREILTGLLGMTPQAVDELERAGVIADEIRVAAD